MHTVYDWLSASGDRTAAGGPLLATPLSSYKLNPVKPEYPLDLLILVTHYRG
jgi:hypothetical protein